MKGYEAPGKLNLSLLVGPPQDEGYHPLESLVQTIEWCDLLEVEPRDDVGLDLEVDGADLDGEQNLVASAFNEAGIDRLSIRLDKRLPVAAGLGGGSSDAAAALLAASDLRADVKPMELAPRIGADVALFLSGGTQMMRGFGEQLESLQPLSGFAVAVVVPDYSLSSTAVYERWDRMEGPVGQAIPDRALPPVLRGRIPIRNDLEPAAIDIRPELGDFMGDVRALWGGPVMLTGSGPACFGLFGDVSEATGAAMSVPGTRAAVGVELRDHGVARHVVPGT